MVRKQVLSWLALCAGLLLAAFLLPSVSAFYSGAPAATDLAPGPGAAAPAIPIPTNEPVLTGHLTWEGRPVQPHNLNLLPVTLTVLLGNVVVNYPNLQTDTSGNFSVPVGPLHTGAYTWWIKGPQYLASSGGGILTGEPAIFQEMGLQAAGDVNNDNLVDIVDFTLLRATFGLACGDPAYDGRADFNGDCLVDIIDFTLLRANFGQSGPVQLSGSCASFPLDNIWHRNIAALPTHALSDAYVNSIGLAAEAHADFGAGLYQGEPIGIPYLLVPGSQPGVGVTFRYPNESDPPPYPVPTNAPVEGGPSSTGDRHVLLLDRDACVLHELYDAYPNPDGSWRAGSGARWSLYSHSLRPDGWTSADAAGLPIYHGLVRYEEVASGVIRHAMRFTAPLTQDAHLWPGRHDAGVGSDPNLPPMGVRLRLKAGVDISGFPLQARVVLQALKDYGMFLADNGQPWTVTGVPDPRWNNIDLHTFHNLHGWDFEAVDEADLMIDPNSGQSR